MDNKPVTIRLIDPPLHEFLPRTEEQTQRLADASGFSVEHIEHQRELLAESNPMLGHRGCRLCISYPEILDMQVRAIMEAAVNCRKRGTRVLPEIMIPLTIDAVELGLLTGRTRRIADAILKDAGVKIKYQVGTMIETPRAALVADEIAADAEFFSFGTNDLTQTTMALSRDDAGRFLPEYVDPTRAGIFEHDPFQTIDRKGVGQLLQMAMDRARTTRPNIKLGICGEHGGDPDSIEFFERVGLDYVSCSPFRVPIARLVAAQVAAAGSVRPRKTATSRKKAAAASPRSKAARKKSTAKKKARPKTHKRATRRR
jgi:pyruvate,orthophosphate dikinase